MNKTALRRATVLAFACVAVAAHADERPLFNTIYGPVGLMTVPTTDVTPKNNVNFGMAIGRDLSSISVNYGIWKDIDINTAYFDRTDASNKVIAGGKVRIIPGNFEWFDLAFGVIDVFDAANQTAYVMVSSKFDNPTKFGQLRLHAGYGTGFYRESFIGGAELTLDKMWSAVAEYNGRNANFGGRFVKDGLRVQAGYGNNALLFSASYGLQF